MFFDDVDHEPWKLTKNLIGSRMPESWDWKEAEHASKAIHKFRLYDDDGILYYEGISCCDSSFDPLEDWGLPNAGCTEIRYWSKPVRDPNGSFAWRTL